MCDCFSSHHHAVDVGSVDIILTIFRSVWLLFVCFYLCRLVLLFLRAFTFIFELFVSISLTRFATLCAAILFSVRFAVQLAPYIQWIASPALSSSLGSKNNFCVRNCVYEVRLNVKHFPDVVLNVITVTQSSSVMNFIHRNENINEESNDGLLSSATASMSM